jgi:hypothetical protein
VPQSIPVDGFRLTYDRHASTTPALPRPHCGGNSASDI